jgi:hypothetical protein
MIVINGLLCQPPPPPISHKSDTSGGTNVIVMLRKHFCSNDCADQSFADDMSREVFLYMAETRPYMCYYKRLIIHITL